MIFNSIRWRLQLWLAFLLVCVLTGFGVTVYQLQRVSRQSQIDQELERRVAVISAEVRDRGPGSGPPPRGGPPSRRGPPDLSPGGDASKFNPRFRKIVLSAQSQGLFNEADTNGFYFAFWSRDQDLLRSSTNAPAKVPFPERTGTDTAIRSRTRGNFREAFHFTEFGECALVGHDTSGDARSLRQFALWIAGAGAVVLALGCGVGWLLTSRAIKPIADISATAAKISTGDLSQRINVADTDNELGRLAGVLNSTFARLDAAFARQKQFTADAAHELRTPLAVLISEAQTVLARERSAADYRESITASLDTAQQMRRLTETLLELARLDAGQETARREKINLADIAQDCVKLTRPLAAARNLHIRCDVAPAVTFCDATRLAQVVTNLLTNAVHYNKDGGEIVVATRAETGAAILTVADTGEGIVARDLPHIFERFYRADKSRSRAEGRAGLGLAISKAIVEAHGGKIEVASQPNVGSTFTVRLRGT